MDVDQIRVVKYNRANSLMNVVLHHSSALRGAGDIDRVVGASNGNRYILRGRRTVVIIDSDGISLGNALSGSQVVGGSVVHGIGPVHLAVRGIGTFRNGSQRKRAQRI